MMGKFDLHVQFSAITCYKKTCGMTFAAPTEWDRDRRKDHGGFYCPNGHFQSYQGETKEQKLRKQIKHIENEHERCMLNLQRKNQDLVLLRMADKEKLFIRENNPTAHIKKSNGTSEISFMCGYKALTSLLNKIDSIQEGQRLCANCSKALEARNLEEAND